MKARCGLAVIGSAALLLGMAPAAHAAPVAPNITCGQVITASVTLNTNLSCPGVAFTLAGGNGPGSTPINAVVNLGGHTVTSTRTDGGPAVHIIQGDDVTVTNGTIKGGYIEEEYSQYTQINFLTLSGAHGGYGGNNAFYGTVSGVTFTNGASAGTSQAVGESFEDNRFVSGPTNAGPAVDIFQSDTLVTDNTITGYSTGVFVEDNRSEALLYSNSISGVHGDGVTIGGVTDSEVPGNIINNTITKNAGDGIALEDGAGIPADGQTSAPLNLTVSGNSTNNNSYDGIHVDPATHGLVPLGINVELDHNVANNNGNLGIEGVKNSGGSAPVTVVDGGHNAAKGNGNKAQCKVVACAA
jgi:hypothetical protein